METIISKLNLPCNLKHIIYEYCYDKLGYTINELLFIEKEKQKSKNKFLKFRHKIELSEWYKFNVSVFWLTPDGVYGKKSPTSVYGGGTLYENKLFYEYTVIDNYIEDKIAQGDYRRKRQSL